MIAIKNDYSFQQAISNCPVLLNGYRILLNDNEQSYLQLYLKNLSDSTITSIDFTFECRDRYENIVEKIDHYSMNNLSFAPLSEMGKGRGVALNNVNTAAIRIVPISIRFSNGEEWKNNNNDCYSPIQAIDYRTMPNSEQFSRECQQHGVTHYEFAPVFDSLYWLCTCGTVNSVNEDKCQNCSIEKQWLVKHSDPLYLHAAESFYEDAIRKESDQNNVEDGKNVTSKEKPSKRKLKTLWFVMTGILLATAIALWFIVFSPIIQYNQAKKLLESGKYDEAIVGFQSVKGVKNSELGIQEAKYQKAVEYARNGHYEEAVELFSDLNGYSNSQEWISSINKQYADAIELMNTEQYSKAITAFEALNGYKDSNQKIEWCRARIATQDAYNEAKKLLQAKKYDEAAKAFEALGNYKDSDETVKECKYLKAVDLYAKGYGKTGMNSIKEAEQIFKNIASYKDSSDILQEINKVYQYGFKLNISQQAGKGIFSKVSFTSVYASPEEKTIKITILYEGYESVRRYRYSVFSPPNGKIFMKTGKLSSQKEGVIEVSLPIETLLKATDMTILFYGDGSDNGKGTDNRPFAFISNYKQLKDIAGNGHK